MTSPGVAAATLTRLRERHSHPDTDAAKLDELEAVARELAGVGLGEGEFRVELAAGEPGPAGGDQAVFLVKPNAGLPFAPVAETASGGPFPEILQHEMFLNCILARPGCPVFVSSWPPKWTLAVSMKG